jgi:hypothetical protein
MESLIVPACQPVPRMELPASGSTPGGPHGR